MGCQRLALGSCPRQAERVIPNHQGGIARDYTQIVLECHFAVQFIENGKVQTQHSPNLREVRARGNNEGPGAELIAGSEANGFDPTTFYRHPFNPIFAQAQAAGLRFGQQSLA
jgi:hypothetical protein